MGMANAGRSAAAGLVPGAEQVGSVLQKPYSGSGPQVESRRCGGGTLEELLGGVRGKALAARAVANGWCRATQADERGDWHFPLGRGGDTGRGTSLRLGVPWRCPFRGRKQGGWPVQ